MIIVNLFGGPSSGKSTLATKLFSELKITTNLAVEYVHEYAKDLVYEQRHNILSKDQLYVFAKQNHMLKMIELSNEIDIIVVDSPILLSAVFGNLNKSTSKKFNELVIEMFNSYNNINVFIERNDSFFQSYGRIENEINAAKKVDTEILKMLDENAIDYIKCKNEDVINNVINSLKNKGIL